MIYPHVYRLASLAALVAFAAAPLSAQPGLVNELIQQGTAYYVFVEEGAPSVEVYVLGIGTQNGVYRLQRGVSLTEALALAGGTARTDTTERQIATATVGVLRTQGATRRAIYRATAEQMLLEPELHPELQTGDIIETQVTYRDRPDPFTFRDGLELAGRVASVVSLFVLLFIRLDSAGSN